MHWVSSHESATMPLTLDRLDEIIAETEVRLTEQVFRVLTLEAEGRSAVEARKVLKALEGLLFEYRRARVLTVEARRLAKDGISPG